MNKFLQATLFFLFVTAFIVSCSGEKAESDPLLVGAAAISINPEVGDFIAGDKQDRRFQGVHDSLYVKAIALSKSEKSMVVLTVDCIGLIYPTLVQIREAAAQSFPDEVLNPSNIVLSSTHTHSGPDVVGLWGENQMSSGVNEEYMKSLVSKSVMAIEKALANRQEAEIRYAETIYGEEWVYNISKPEELDRSLTVIQFKDSEGHSIASMTNFACHPTFMDAATDLVSADYLGGFYDEMDEKLQGTNLFLQGAIGGWVQPEHEAKTFESAMSRGKEFAGVTLSALKESKSMDSEELVFRSQIFSLPVSNPGFQQLSSLGVIQRAVTDSVETEIAWFEIGKAKFVTHPGETSPFYSIESKKLMQSEGPKFVLGLGMDGLGYIVTPDFFDPAKEVPHAGYMTGMSIDQNAGPMIMEVIEELAEAGK